MVDTAERRRVSDGPAADITERLGDPHPASLLRLDGQLAGRNLGVPGPPSSNHHRVHSRRSNSCCPATEKPFREDGDFPKRHARRGEISPRYFIAFKRDFVFMQHRCLLPIAKFSTKYERNIKVSRGVTYSTVLPVLSCTELSRLVMSMTCPAVLTCTLLY